MGGTAWRSLEIAYKRQSDIQEHHQHQAHVRRPRLHSWKKMRTKRGRQIMVGLGGGIYMPLLDMVRIIHKACERQISTLVHGRRAPFHKITEKNNDTEIADKGKEKILKV